MISLNSIFILIWKTVLGYFVFFVAFMSVPVVSDLWADVKQSENVQNYVNDSKYLTIGDSKINLLIADSTAERIKGLSGRPSLKENQGMLFIFDSSDKHGIWMKDMLIPIDIVWLDSSFQVVDFAENVSPETYPNVYKPKKDSLYVVELNSGFVKAHGIKVLDQATLFD